MLTRFILARVVPEYEDSTNVAVRTRIGRLEAWVSMLVNGLLAALKLTLGLAANSLALIADGVHSLSDVATSGVVMFGFTISGRPADKEHPFGHGRAEYVATLVIAVMLGVVGFEFIKSAAGRFLLPVAVQAGWGVLLALLVSILVKEWLGRFSRDLGRRIDSATLKADAWHHRSDAISSLLVLAAVWGSSRGYPALDAAGGVLVGVYLIWSGFAIAKEVIDPLLGEPPSPELIARIRELCRSQEQVIDVHDITVHDYGQHKFIGAHVEVSNRLSTQEAHDVAEEVTDLLRHELNAYATVHIDPVDRDSEIVKQVRRRLDELVLQSDTFEGFHDVRVVSTPEHNAILFDMVVSAEAGENRQLSARRWLERELALTFPGSTIEINISPLHTYG